MTMPTKGLSFNHRGPLPDVLEAGIHSPASDWSVSTEMARLLSHLILRHKPRSLLEYGCGQSSVVLAAALAESGGGTLTSIDHAPEYATNAWEQLSNYPSVDALMIVSRLGLRVRSQGVYYSYVEADQEITRRAPYDFVFIDAPPGRFHREDPLFQACRFLRPGALVVVDDAARSDEQTAIRRWLRAYPHLELQWFDEHVARGVAVLRAGDRLNSQVSPRSFLGSIHDRLLDLKRQTQST